MNTVYNASAGTGKTYQVTQLYEKLVLEDGINPRKILLMTFTDNAADELRARVFQRLLKARRTAESEGNDERSERVRMAMSILPSAPIGTIHSFCTRLLREHALEAGLSPDFTVLPGDEGKELLDRICRDELISRLETDPDFRIFCAGTQITGTSKRFGTSITESVRDLIDRAGSLGISLEHAEDLIPEPEPAGTLAGFSDILDRLHELPAPTAKAKPFIEALERLLPAAGNVEELVEGLKKKGLKGRKFGGGKGHKSISDDFFDLLNAADDAIQYRKRFPWAKAFARFVQSVHCRFQESKHRMDAVDFDDQLRMAVGLLRSGKVKTEFQHVIVDEVQDTSRIQCDIIQALWDPGASLVICGDKKQSIYTWRGADPQVMPDLEQLIMDAGGKRENLQTSYRSKAPVIDVVNALFEKVYEQDSYSVEDRLEPNPDFATDGEKTCVEFLMPDEELNEYPKQDKVAAEMEAVANRIRLLVMNSGTWNPAYRYGKGGFEASTKDSNAYKYSDILVLLRRTTHQSALEHALRHAGIPYTLGGKGRGLFTRQETRDVSLFLNVVTNPGDAYSLIGFLRSPWVGLSDATIAELASGDNGFSIDNLMARYGETTDVVDRYREHLATKLASELVRMLIEETGYDALLSGLPRGTQRLANLQKVLDWLREAERGAQTTPAAVARKLAGQIGNPPQTPEAALPDPTQNAVTIMTVHGAKGLTKHVVFVPDLNTGPNADRSFAQVFFDEQHQAKIGLKMVAPDKSAVESPGFREAKERAKTIREHESNNLLYVAMTRARDLVVTSATVGQRISGWLKQMEPLIGLEIASIPYSAINAAAEEPPAKKMRIPSYEELSTALQSLPPPPARPPLRRIPATIFAKEMDELEASVSDEQPSTFFPGDHSAALGTLGHAVLEQLALNDWQGSVADWLEILRSEFRIGKADAASLADRIQQTRDLMLELTSLKALHPEFPFVLHDGERLIDGTIDLVCQATAGIEIFDYKFTEADDSSVTDSYHGQMEIYSKAATSIFDPPSTNAKLVVVSKKGPRLVPVSF